MDDDDVYWGTRLACVEMIRTGTTRFWDMYWHAHATARAVEDAGVRAVTAAPLIDDSDPAKSERACADARPQPRADHRGRRRAGAARARTARDLLASASARCAGLPSAPRSSTCRSRSTSPRPRTRSPHASPQHGERPAFYLDRVGLLGPRTVLAHGCWLDRDELELIAERGATIVTNPVANLKLAVGRVFPYRDARDAGVEVGLGTDGPGSNNSLDLLADAKTFALLQKNEARDPAAVTAAETLAIATGRRSGLLGGRGLEVGRAGRLPARPLRRSRALAR